MITPAQRRALLMLAVAELTVEGWIDAERLPLAARHAKLLAALCREGLIEVRRRSVDDLRRVVRVTVAGHELVSRGVA